MKPFTHASVISTRQSTFAFLLRRLPILLLYLILFQSSSPAATQFPDNRVALTASMPIEQGLNDQFTHVDSLPMDVRSYRFETQQAAASDLEPRISFISDIAVVLEYPSLYDVHDPPDPNYPNIRIQPAEFDTPRILDDLAAVVSSDHYDFVLLYTLQEVPAWINAGPRYWCPAKNIGLLNTNCNPQQPWPPPEWPRLRSAPHMNDVAFIGMTTFGLPNYGSSLTAFHEIGHLWGAYITYNSDVGPREWTPDLPVAWLAGVGSHWSWVWYEPGMPGIMYSGARSPRYNEFDLYAMGLMGYAEASTVTHQLYEHAIPPPPQPTLHDVTLDDLIYSLSLGGSNYFEGNGRRIPDTDPSVADLHTLIVVVKGEDETLTMEDRELVLQLAALIPTDWDIATWGRSAMSVDVLSDLLPARQRVTPSLGAPGSVFRVDGSRFAPDTAISLSINGSQLGSVTSTEDGELHFMLSTDYGLDGCYVISAQDHDTALAVFYIDSASTLSVQTGQGPTFEVTPRLAQSERLFVPLLLATH